MKSCQPRKWRWRRLLTDLDSDLQVKGLRLAVQGSLVKGDDMEESQFRVSATLAGEDEYVEFWPAGTLAKG
jgi:hypothetical protein